MRTDFLTQVTNELDRLCYIGVLARVRRYNMTENGRFWFWGHHIAEFHCITPSPVHKNLCEIQDSDTALVKATLGWDDTRALLFGHTSCLSRTHSISDLSGLDVMTDPPSQSDVQLYPGFLFFCRLPVRMDATRSFLPTSRSYTFAWLPRLFNWIISDKCPADDFLLLILSDLLTSNHQPYRTLEYIGITS